MRLGVFGGSFDPVHYGHLLLAENARELCQLDEVWFVPAATPPHKQDRGMSQPTDRLAMLKLAIAGHPQFAVCAAELERGGISYTVDTLTEIQRRQPKAELFFLMGADSLADLPGWREPETICRIAMPIVVRRARSPEPDFDRMASLLSAERLAAIKANQIEVPLIELSSTDLRRRAAEGTSLRYRTPRAVEMYLRDKRLYEGATG